ncbi:MAG TPA: hypothetical protein ENI68_08515 [Gammaproteobacteria bacterium]|nr:hypothetical protein [Gammaproteobacteria bacterium]
MVVKSIKALVAIVLVIAATNGSVNAAGQAQIDPAALAAVAQTYFDALRGGDRQALLALLAGNERARSAAQLNDPAYSRFLTDRYKNARLEIMDGGMSSGVSYIDITIWLNATESVKERLILKALSGSGGSPLSIVARKELD